MRRHQTALMSCHLTANFVVSGITGVDRPNSGRYGGAWNIRRQEPETGDKEN